MNDVSDEPVRVLFHLNGGYTKIIFERTIGVGLADGGISWDISTDRIPFNLRNIGSRFLICRYSEKEFDIKEID